MTLRATNARERASRFLTDEVGDLLWCGMVDQRAYWDAADSKTFTHPLAPDWLGRIGKSDRILDFGCGYGRLCRELDGLGFRNVLGVDTSSRMIARAKRDLPHLGFRLIDGTNLNCEPDSF